MVDRMSFNWEVHVGLARLHLSPLYPWGEQGWRDAVGTYCMGGEL